MRYAISYVSTANLELRDQAISDIMAKTNEFNKSRDISGILLYNERSFFQLIEGEQNIIEDLYRKIAEDSRHHDIIKFLEKPVSRPPFDGYMTDFITDTNRFNEAELKNYLHYIEVLNPESQVALKRVMELMMV